MRRALGLLVAAFLAASAGLALAEFADEGEKAAPVRHQLVVSAHQVTLWALENNLEVSIESLNPGLRHTELVTRLAAFDPAFYFSSSVSHYVSPLASTTIEGEKKYIKIDEDLRSRYERFTAAAGLRKKFETGGTASVEFSSDRVVTKDLSPGAVFDINPLINTAGFSVNLSHPLLRGRGGNYNLALVRAARNSEKVARHYLEARMMRVASQAQQAYWMLVFVRSDLQVEEQSLKRAEELLEAVSIQVELGKSAGIELTRAQANVAAKREGIITAQKAVKDAQDELRRIINLKDDDLLEDIEVLPVDDGSSYQPREVQRQQAVFQALGLRPELQALRTLIENRRLDQKLARNQLLPKLDVEAGAGVSGWEESWNQAREFLPEGSFYSWQVSLNLELPIDNRAAKANYTRSKLQLQQDLLRLRKLEDDVRVQVKQHVRQVHTNLERIEAARAYRELAEEAARREKARYEEGISTFLELREAEETLALAQSQEVAAVVDYHVSLATLAQSTGSILRESQLLFKQE